MLKPNRILFKNDKSNTYEEYVGIGEFSFDPNNPEKTILPDNTNLEGWKAFMEDENKSRILNAFNFILLSGSDEQGFQDEQMLERFKSKHNVISTIIENWFEPESSIFKYLDFTSDENERLSVIKVDANGLDEILFEGGLMIRINEMNTDLHQLFIPEDIMIKLDTDLSSIRTILFDEYDEDIEDDGFFRYNSNIYEKRMKDAFKNKQN